MEDIYCLHILSHVELEPCNTKNIEIEIEFFVILRFFAITDTSLIDFKY